MSELRYNSLIDAKINLRVKYINLLFHTHNIAPRILDVYAGPGEMWTRAYGRTSEYKGIESDTKHTNLGRDITYGKALDVLPTLDINNYTVFDLDSFANPWPELEYILKHLTLERCVLFITESMSRNIALNNLGPEISRHIRTRDSAFRYNITGIFRYLLALKLSDAGYMSESIELVHKTQAPQTIYCATLITRSLQPIQPIAPIT